MFFEIAGFLLFLFLGFILGIWGIVGFWWEFAWSGRENFWLLLLTLAGAVIIFFTFKYGPVTIGFS